ncbi:putative ABC transporter superfamily membrane protein Pdr11p [Pseudohyphozyma bogoriensis]|nr:putative ABC transporter superfamily membrane protein Pdr11p [Pseudohyphozyma bogoriensis]
MSARTSVSELTAADPRAHVATNDKTHKPIFAEPGTMPLPDAGHHHLGVVWEDVTVFGSGATRKTVESLDMSMIKMWDLPGFIMKLAGIKVGKTRPLISNFTGVIPEGQTCLVLGRPGAVRALANNRAPFVKIDGDIHYSSIDAKEAKKYYEGEIVFNSEDDTHLPLLTVEQTFAQALSLKKPRKLATPTKTRAFVKDHIDRLLHTFGMPHTRRTFVGNDFVRGVSGGERKRVTLSEMLTTNAAVVSWDNSVRGLDSAVALHYLKVLKELSLSTGMTNIVSIYQASQEMWDLCFDRVVLIFEGEMVFSGRTVDAEAYFIEQGWYKKPRQTTPDFLTSCTSVTERQMRPDVTHPVPQTPQEMAAYFRASPQFQQLQDEIKEYKFRHSSSSDAAEFRREVAASKHPLTGKSNPYKSNFFQQVAVLARSQMQIQKADPRTIIIKIACNILQAVLVGAIFYKPNATATGAYEIAGAIFFTILYFVIQSFGEIPSTVMARPLLVKHRTLGFYNPAAFAVAQMLSDAPIYALQTIIFTSIFYFLVGLEKSAAPFFTFFFVIFTVYMSLSVMFRMLSVAVRYGSISLAVVLTLAGFMNPAPDELKWSSWIRRISPASYALEALLASQFQSKTLTCDSTQLVPNGPTYTSLLYQGCTILGSTPGSAEVAGSTYLAIKYEYYSGHIWRNVGILWAMYVIYAIFIILGSSLLIKDNGGASTKLYIRGAKIPDKPQRPAPQVAVEKVLTRQGDAENEKTKDLSNAPVFTFKDVRYTVKVGGKDKVLLDGITGLVQPGKLTALMGASGAGKTTLLDTISKRKTVGKVEGELLIDGKALDSTFSRRTGFVQQGDIHEQFSTVRECLQFSALLRQPADVSREEKLAYVEEIIDLLEMGEIADALVGNAEVGGLGVEERKRLTIGVELAAHPDFLLFLDEPTSGLDSQAAYEIVRFLRKITASGIAVLCTIHQPSGDLFEMFDAVVLLAPGGRTVYAGPTGENASIVTGYFGNLGAMCPPGANPAEFIISTVAPVGGTTTDWPAFWKQSAEAREMEDRIARISARNTGNVAAEELEGPPFAASFREQTMQLIWRNFKANWREGPTYLTKIVTLIFFGMFVGFFNYKLPSSLAGISAKTLGLLTVMQGLPPLSLDIAMNFLAKWDIYVGREKNGIYSWQALVTALIVTDMPVFIIGYILLFFCYFWAMGFDSNPGVGGITFMSWVLVGMFNVTQGIMLGAVSPTPFAIPFVLSLVWNLFNVLSWCLVGYSALPTPFRYFFSWLSPLRWIYEALMASEISPLVITCAEDELTRFNIPSGETCASYAAAFMETAVGYLSNPDATSNCGYCQYSTGADYMATFGYHSNHAWRGWGIFLVFFLSNFFVIYGATWWLRVRPLFKN